MENINDYLLDIEYVEKIFNEDKVYNLSTLGIKIISINTYNNETVKLYSEEDLIKPTIQKLLIIKDMKNRGFDINRNILHKYGFNRLELNWLHENGWLNE